MRILVVAPAPLGDTLFITPALRALRRGFAEAGIDVIAAEKSKEILHGNDNLDSLFTVRGKAGLIHKIIELRSTEYDLAAGLSRTGSFFLPLVRAEDKAGLMSPGAGDNPGVLDHRYSIHAADYCLGIAEMLGGVSEDEPELELPVSRGDSERVASLVRGAISSVAVDAPLVAIHPGGRFFSLKRWPIEKFTLLVSKLDRRGVPVVFVGGENDCDLAERVIDNAHTYYHRPLNFCGRLSVKETAALLESCSLFVGNDSGPMHIAAAVGTPVVGLFGPTSEVNFHPYCSEYRIVAADMECRPCFYWLGDLKQYLPDYLPEWATGCPGACMEKITVRDVMEEVDHYLAGVKKELI